MSDTSAVQLKPDAAQRSARPSGRLLFRLRAYLVALLVGALPILYVLATVLFSGLALHHMHMMVMEIHFDDRFGAHDLRLLWIVLAEAVGGVLLLRQVVTPEEPTDAYQEIMRGDQAIFFKTVQLVARTISAPMPQRIMVDSSASLRAEYPGLVSALLRRDLRLRIGLALPVGLESQQMVGLLAHELSFFGSGIGARSARFIRGVDRWFFLRIRHDPWLEWLGERIRFSVTWTGRIGFGAMWGVVWLSLRPLRLLYSVCRLVSGGTLRGMVRQADECAARCVGAQVYAASLLQRAVIARVWAREDGSIAKLASQCRLPDSIPMLVARKLMDEPVDTDLKALGKTRTHWLDLAPRDATRIRRVLNMRFEAIVEAAGTATDLFRNFHEVSRHITYFHYQNDLGLSINEHMLVAVEESVHNTRPTMETVDVLNHYFRGLAHPERAFCGIAAEQTALRAPEALCAELMDCRRWLDVYGERMASSLDEWSRTWQLVRDLEMGYLLARAGMPVPRGQFSIREYTPDAFRNEISRQRGVMDNLECLLREHEGRLETRLACALELMWRAEGTQLPDRLMAMRETLPHWVLVYEALGLHLPVIREVMTRFHAFQALGASVAGSVDSVAFLSTVSNEVPHIEKLVKDVLGALSEWPYPFQTNFGAEPVTLAAFIAPQAMQPGGLDFSEVTSPMGDSRIVAQQIAKKAVNVVAPMLDRYLSLYHQSFAWVTKAADMAEWHFVEPPGEPVHESTLRDAPAMQREPTPERMVSLGHQFADPELAQF